jgi:ribosomal protein L37AE/L43A
MKHLNEILRLLNSLLGPSRKIKDEFAFSCPFCNHKKKKLQVSIERGVWNCWVCPAKGRSLYTLFKRVGTNPKTLARISEITSGSRHTHTVESEETVLYLPSGFKSMLEVNDSSLDYRHAKHYLDTRGITRDDIIKHNIGYCEDGAYGGRIIIPSYDGDGSLNYFVARAFYNIPHKYKNPPTSRDVVIFNLHINWNEPIVLCEGVFDAIAIKSNAIPLLGKFIPKKLHDKIMRSNTPAIHIALDSDARNDALKIVNKYLNQGFVVKLVDLTGKDPSDMGFEKMNEMIPIDMGFKTLMMHKINGA